MTAHECFAIFAHFLTGRRAHLHRFIQCPAQFGSRVVDEPAAAVLFKIGPRRMMCGDDGCSMGQRLGNYVAKILAAGRQHVAAGMSKQPAFLQLVNVARPKALVGNPKFSGKLSTLVYIGSLPASRNDQPPIRCAKCKGRSAGRRTLAALHLAPCANQQIQPLLGMETR